MRGWPSAARLEGQKSYYSELLNARYRDALLTPTTWAIVATSCSRLPWALDDRSSFVETGDEYLAALTAAGFAEVEVEDRTGPVPGAPPPNQQLGPADILGPTCIEGVTNHIAATRAGLLGGLLIFARA